MFGIEFHYNNHNLNIINLLCVKYIFILLLVGKNVFLIKYCRSVILILYILFSANQFHITN
jgi:hypothetical protein